jgi:cytochrome P450
MTDLTDLVRIDDPEWYVGDPYPGLARLRSEAPALYYESLDTFAITRYKDVREISRAPELWSVKAGIVLNDAKYGNVAESFFPEGAELISTTDPPRHREIRRVISPVFTPKLVQGMEPMLREYARAMVDRIENGKEIEFVEEVAVPLPIYTVCRLLGLPGDNIADIRYWSDEMVKMGGDLTPDELVVAAQNAAPAGAYLGEWLARKRSAPDEFLLSTLLRAEIENEKITDLNVVMLSTAVLVAGNGTTRNLIGDAVATLAQHPEQLAKLADDPTLLPAAVDETLRWFTPVPGFIRTALADTELHDQPVKAGQHVYLMYMSANHDETVFEDPETFDVTRAVDPSHVAFGYGQHVCPGASVARLEAKILLEELIGRFPSWEITGTPVRRRSVLENGFVSLPVTFQAA